MANDSAKGRKPRIRKTAPTVREQIEGSAKQEDIKPKKSRRWLSLIAKPFSVFKVLAPVFKPLAPIGKAIIRVLRWLAPRYFINAWRELRQVTWPNRRETWRLTGAVVVFAIIFGALVAVVDKGLDEFFKKVILK